MIEVLSIKNVIDMIIDAMNNNLIYYFANINTAAKTYIVSNHFLSHVVFSNSGIAIGPILFIVAILAILATAISAGSSTFATNASQETNRTNAGSMIQIGSSLKTGVDRLAALGNPISTIVLNPATTTGNISVFSPTGGGLVPPSTALANTPASDAWVYTWGNISGLGTTNNERVATLRVSAGVCNQINTIAGITYTLPATVNYGDFYVNASNNIVTTSWPSNLSGRMVGCFQNTNAAVPTSDGYYFYQILAIQ
jgi:hypothetical protein